MAKSKHRGPSCLGSIVLFAAVVLVLKTAYAYAPTLENAASENGSEEAASTPLYDAILQELCAYSTEITFLYDCTSDLFDTFERVCEDHPELFWVNGSGTSEKRTIGDHVTVTLKPEPIMTLVELLDCRERLNLRVEEILDGVEPAWTNYEKILYIHDTLVENTEYDYETAAMIDADTEYSKIWQSSSAYGCLVEGRAVCAGYAAAFQLLMHELDIPCIRVEGTERDSGVLHEWNCVKLNEKWYYVDVTWDDPMFTEDSPFESIISHEYCMITEEMLAQTHLIDKNKAVPACTDLSQSYYVRNGQYLETYSYPAATEIIASQLDRGRIELQLSSKAEAERACADLFDAQRIYEIAGMENIRLTYSIGKNGLVRIALLPQNEN